MFIFFNSSANASPEFEGRGGEELGSMLAKTLERAYNHPSAIDLESLCILPGKQCWVLYIDAVVNLSNNIDSQSEYGIQHAFVKKSLVKRASSDTGHVFCRY